MSAAAPLFRNLVFVYGTLMRGQMRGLDLVPEPERARFIGDASVSGATLVVPHGAPFPALVRAHAKPDDAVDGELWDVDNAVLTMLDRIEGATSSHRAIDGHLYERVTVRVALVGHVAHVDAFTYEWARSEWMTRPIGHSWRAYRRQFEVSGSVPR